MESNLTVMGRTRYNIWDLLGDVGGFNDGLVLVSSILFSFYGLCAFKKDLISNTHVDGDISSKHSSKSIAV